MKPQISLPRDGWADIIDQAEGIIQAAKICRSIDLLNGVLYKHNIEKIDSALMEIYEGASANLGHHVRTLASLCPSADLIQTEKK